MKPILYFKIFTISSVENGSLSLAFGPDGQETDLDRQVVSVTLSAEMCTVEPYLGYIMVVFFFDHREKNTYSNLGFSLPTHITRPRNL